MNTYQPGQLLNFYQEYLCIIQLTDSGLTSESQDLLLLAQILRPWEAELPKPFAISTAQQLGGWYLEFQQMPLRTSLRQFGSRPSSQPIPMSCICHTIFHKTVNNMNFQSLLQLKCLFMSVFMCIYIWGLECQEKKQMMLPVHNSLMLNIFNSQ